MLNFLSAKLNCSTEDWSDTVKEEETVMEDRQGEKHIYLWLGYIIGDNTIQPN